MITPIGLFFRIIRKDPLQINNIQNSYWIDSDQKQQTENYNRQF
jgi:hypothetical protein